jgi:surface protein
MFKNCKKLKFLDLSYFDTKSVINMEGMFSECKSLIYLNIKSFTLYNSININ